MSAPALKAPNPRAAPHRRFAKAGKRPKELREAANPLIHASAVLISAMLGITATDRLGFERSEIINPTNLLRLGTISTLGLMMFWFMLHKRVKVFDAPCLVLTAFYLYQLVPIFLNWSDYSNVSHLKQALSIGEWLIIIWGASAALNFSAITNFNHAIILLRQVLQLLSIYTILFLAAAGLYSRELIYFDSMVTSLGGYAIHPNKLSIICALGVLAWLDDREVRYSTLTAIFLLFIAVLTGSRSGMVACVLAFSFGLTRRLPQQFKTLLYWVLSIGFAFTIVLILGENRLITAALSRFGLADLNSRDYIWDGTVRMAGERLWFGWGWLEGPARLNTYVDTAWFAARNAQNDLLNMQIASGMLATVMLLLVYLRNFFIGMASEIKEGTGLVLGATGIVFLSSLVEPVLSTRVTSVGLAFIFVTLAAGRYRRSKALGKRLPLREGRRYSTSRSLR